MKDNNYRGLRFKVMCNSLLHYMHSYIFHYILGAATLIMALYDIPMNTYVY